MIDKEFSTLGLYDHNAASYKKVRDAFNDERQIVSIVHATGTGKSYNALQLAYDNKDKKIVYVVPYQSIVEHLQNIIKNNSNLDLERDFPNLEFRTYQSFINMSREEIEDMDIDLLILDEFHHIGAPIWGNRIDTIVDTHGDMKIFGMTAYTVRDRGTSYERDMAEDGGNELFSDTVVSRYDLADAIIDGVLPKPNFKTAIHRLEGFAQSLEELLNKANLAPKDYQELSKLLYDVKKRVSEAPGNKELMQKYIKSNGKYFYFCPVNAEDGRNDIDTIMEEARKRFSEIFPDKKIVFYKTTSKDIEEGKKNREAFYYDKTLDGEDASNTLRIMFCINQYNEGVHAPNVDGAIMGRGTQSDIVFFEQLGRALAVNGDTKKKYEEYEQYSIEELKNICHQKDIKIEEGLSKEDIIEKLIAPVIIDLAGNYNFIKELETNVKDRIKMISESEDEKNKRIVKLCNASFDIDILNVDLYEMLCYIKERLTMTWGDKYNLAKVYYETYGNLEIPQSFKTFNGKDYDENGVALGVWISTQRTSKKNGSLSQERENLLLQIGMRFDNKKNTMSWEEMYNLAKVYYETYGNLEIPAKFKTFNGKDYDKNGVALGQWIVTQRQNKKNGSLSHERENLLLQIGMRLDNKINTMPWEEIYALSKVYYETYDNLEIPQGFKTSNGKDYDENGVALGMWISNQRQSKKNNTLSYEREKMLLQIGMRFDNKINTMSWEEMYALAKVYYETYDNSEMPSEFKTFNGKDYDENGIKLGQWINWQRKSKKKETLSREREEMLLQIGMRFENKKSIMSWEEMYALSKVYYETYGNLEIPQRFKTVNGKDYDENGVALGIWISNQRQNKKNGTLLLKREQMLLEIGMDFDNKVNTMSWEEWYNLAKIYYETHGHLEIKTDFKTTNGKDYDEKGAALGQWISKQRQGKKNNTLSLDRENLLLQIGMRFDNKKNTMPWEEWYNLVKIYYETYDNSKIPQSFKTFNGKDYDENGVALGRWINKQRLSKKKGSMSLDREILLNNIGMIWDTKNNKPDIEKVCHDYNINYKKYEKSLDSFMVEELLAKLQYLTSHNIPIIDESGNLNSILFMSRINLQAQYGIDIVDLINENIEKNKKK